MSIALEVTGMEIVTAKLQRVAAQLQRPRLLMQACGRRVENILHRHFLSRDAEGNKHGWARSHWWNREVNHNTALQSATDTEARVSIASRQFAQRLRGGKIQGHPYLALPLTAQAKAKGSPGEWSKPGDGQLQFIRSKLGSCYLFPGEGQSHGASYLLVRSVTQKPDPRALPPRGDIEAGVDDEAGKFLREAVK
jgi:hypothetical protein